MPVNYFVHVRQKTKLQLMDFITGNQDKPMKQILALFSLKTGLKTSTLATYLRELKDANMIMEKGD